MSDDNNSDSSVQSDSQPDIGSSGSDAAPRAQMVEPDTSKDPNVPIDSPLYQPTRPSAQEQAQDQYQDALQHEIEWRKKFESDSARAVKEQQWAHQRMEELMSQPLPKMPSFDETYPQQTAPPDQKQQDRSRWGSLMAYAAIALPLAFMLGKKGPAAWGAMKGFAEGIKAINQGYQDRAAQAGAVWKAQNDLALRRGEQYMNYYKDVIQNRKMDLEEKKEMIGEIAAQTNDQVVADKAQAGNWHDLVTALSQREKLVDNAHKTRAVHEKAILKEFGLDATHKDYLNRLMMKYPDLRDGLSSDDPTIYRKAYDEATKRYKWQAFLQDRHKEIAAESKARAKSSGLDDSEKDEDKDQSQSDISPEDASKLDDFAKKLRGGQ